MGKMVRYTADELRQIDIDAELQRLSAMPADQIDTSDIPERPFDRELAAKRKREGWRPGSSPRPATHKKAS